LEELIEAAGDVEKLEKAVEQMEQKLVAAKQEKEKAAVAVQTKPEVTKVEKPIQEQPGKSRGNWW
jgi:hypothetical protein